MRHSKKAVFATFFALTLPVSAIALASAGADRGNSTTVATKSQSAVDSHSGDVSRLVRHIGYQFQVAQHEQYLKRRHRRYLRHVAYQKKLARIAAKAARVASTQASAPPVTGATPAATAPSGNLQAIAQCESGGNPSAIGGGGAYRGKYQFDYGTWASVGGSGDPAAASESEQDMRAAMLYAKSGSTPWPVCGR